MRDRRSDQGLKTPVAVTGNPSMVLTGNSGGGARFAGRHLLAHDLAPLKVCLRIQMGAKRISTVSTYSSKICPRDFTR